jgi:CO dehydrogenase nickel-insertion accessory protein CooC1
MINYNLYQGCDALIGVVEDHRNSIRVLKQIQQTVDRLGCQVYVVLNQAVEDRVPNEGLENWGEQLLGVLPRDEAIATYDYVHVDQQTKDAIGIIWRSILGMTSNKRIAIV